MAGIADLLQAITIGQQNDQKLTSQAVQTTEQQQQLGQQMVQAQEAADAAQIQAKQQELEGQLRSQQAARQIAEAWGGNPDAANFKLAELGTQFWDSYNKVQAQDKAIAQKQQTGFFDNPLTWIANQFTLPSDIEARDANARIANTASAAMQEINTNIVGSAAAQKSIAETVTRDSIKQAMDAASYQSQVNSLKLQQTNLSYDLNGIKLLMDQNDRSMNRQLQVNSALVQQQQLAISAGHLALAQQEARDRAARRADELAAKQEDKQGWIDAAATYNVGSGTLGLQPVSPEELKQRIKFGGDAARKDFETMYATGIAKANNPGGNGTIGATPGSAAVTIATKRAPLNAGMEPTRSFLMGTMQDAARQAQALDPTKPLKAESVASSTTDLVGQRVGIMSKDVSKDAPWGKNIYTAPDYKTMLSIPAVGNSAFGKVVVGPQAANGGNATNPDALLDAGLAAVNAGQLSYQDMVAGFTNYFSAAMNWNNSTKNFAAVSIPMQSSYKTSLYNGTNLPFGKTNIVDLSNRQQVENFILRRRANQTQSMTDAFAAGFGAQ